MRTPITLEFLPNNPVNKTLTNILKIFKSFPIVLKPYEGVGSRGVQIINNKTELIAALNQCEEFQKINPAMSKKFLIQEYIDGNEGYLDFYSMNGKHLLTDSWMYVKQISSGNNLGFYDILLMKKNTLLAKSETYCKKVLDVIGYK
ncbi:MAG: ATP-grasp domain-containing protein [Methanobrevibacter sp.]|nr:ATP-grasp domain-containing protein [Candidatus Methanovirga basalitermitum]